MTTTAARPLVVALIGNPNTGKSTLFSALSGYQSLTGNYPGCTVEKKLGKMRIGDQAVTLVDLPGTYSLSPRTLDEMVAVNVLLGRQADVGAPDVVVCIVDASNLERNLYLVSQVLDMERPTVLVLNMRDVAAERGVRIDAAQLGARLGVAVVETQAHRKQGMAELKQAIVAAADRGAADRPEIFPEIFAAECGALGDQLAAWGQAHVPMYLRERLLLDVGGYLESHFPSVPLPELRAYLEGARGRLTAAGSKPPGIEARARYAWARRVLDGVCTRPSERVVTWSDRLDRVLTHWASGLLIFVLMMFVVFQSIYTWAAPLMEAFEAAQGWLTGLVAAVIAPGALRSLLVDGVIGGVGGVLIFVPQIALLFLFIALLEDCGYMARAAFLMDKLMTRVGLSGKSFVPLMSSFACAIPGVMATRVIENRRDRMTTILVAPLMSCSARQPVYALMIAAFVPATTYAGGWITLHGLTLFFMTFLGALVAIPIAWILKKTLFRGETPPFVMELPTYKWPSLRIVVNRVFDRVKAFVVRAGTLIFATSILVWAAGYFPGDHREEHRLQAELERMEAELQAPLEQRARLNEAAESSATGLDKPDAGRLAELDVQLRDYDARRDEKNALSAELLRNSALGRLGQAIEPAVRPLGWDWKIGIGVLASFPAREVIVSTLGTIYSLGQDVSESDPGLISALEGSKWPDGRPVFSLPVAVSIMVFFALCAQCASTLMVIKRETNSWLWPALTFSYMTALAYAGAFIAYRLMLALTGG